MTAKKTTARQTFEEALERLETIVCEMEEGSISLDIMMKSFEEGMGLIKFCTEKLNQVEKKIEILVKKGGEITTEPFETGEQQRDEA